MSESERPCEVWIAKIRKILSKTETAGCTKDESEAAFALATRLLAEHNLEMSDIEAKDAPVAEWDESEIFATGKWSREHNLAYNIVREFCFIEGFYNHRYEIDARGHQKHKKVLTFFGKKENVETARFMFGALLASYDRLWITYRYLMDAPASDRRAYVVGVATGFSTKLREERKVMEAERDLMKSKTSGSTALALVTVSQETNAKYKEKYPKHKSSRSGFAELRGGQDAFDSGCKAGRALNLNRAIGGRPKAPRELTVPYVFALHPVHGNFTVDAPEFKLPRLDKGWNHMHSAKAERLLDHVKKMDTILTCECNEDPIYREIPVSEFTWQIRKG